jgi:hypothetical protein
MDYLYKIKNHTSVVDKHHYTNRDKSVQNDQGAYGISGSSARIPNNTKLCFAL